MKVLQGIVVDQFYHVQIEYVMYSDDLEDTLRKTSCHSLVNSVRDEVKQYITLTND